MFDLIICSNFVCKPLYSTLIFHGLLLQPYFFAPVMLVEICISVQEFDKRETDLSRRWKGISQVDYLRLDSWRQ